MEAEQIIQAITKIFNGADERNWGKVQAAFADKVLLDYSSMNGNPVTVISSEKIIKGWKGFLPGFDMTHHQLSDFKVDQKDNAAQVHFFGKADHYISKDSWTVEGTYDAELIKSADKWEVTKFKFNLQKQSGDTALPQKAIEIAGKK
jgi:hypothetical protein